MLVCTSSPAHTPFQKTVFINDALCPYTKNSLINLIFIKQNMLSIQKQIELTLNMPENLQLYGLYVYYVVHICDFGMLRVKQECTLATRLTGGQNNHF